MTQEIDMDDWKLRGKELWSKIQAHKLVFFRWNNPWIRLASIGLPLLLISTLSWLVWKNALVAIPIGLLSIPLLYKAIQFFLVGKKTGGLYFFFTEQGFGVGCDNDRILIPYNNIRLVEAVNPGTVNNNFIYLPVCDNPSGIRVETKDGRDTLWDGNPYKRGIISVEKQSDSIIAKAFPNEIIVHFFLTLYPLSVFLLSEDLQPETRNQLGLQ